MTKKIQRLSSGVVKKLRSGIAFTNVAHCVEELVLNSIDAGANCIAVHLNLPFYRIQVIDNGHGIDVQQIKLIGTRYATSKCHTLDDLQNLRSGGFRGEALASLKEISSILMIESRTASSNETYCKIFTQGKAADPKKSLNCRPSKGTTVSVYDFMYNMPVRKNSISEALDLEECRRLLQSIALMYPNISFTLKNEVTGEMNLQLKKCSSLYYSFLQMFGKSNAANLKNIDYKSDEYEINGYVSTVCHLTKELQFLYINKRRVLRTKLHKLINSILNKALNSRQKSNNSSLTPDGSSPSKNYSMCIFVINISCPYDKYDIIFEPRKTMIEFSDWHTVLKIVEDSLINFLKKENLYSNANESEANLFNVDLGINHNYPNFDIQNCKQGLFSNAVCRQDPVLEGVNPSDDNTAQHNTEELKDSGNSSISIGTKSSDEFITNVVKKTNIFTESDFTNNERKTKSYAQEPCLYSDSIVSSLSTLDSLKSISEQSIALNNKSVKNISNSEEELGIPRRSVFPSGSPVMLHVPIKSILSDLQTSTSNSNFLRLKDKFKFLPKKVKINQSNSSKFDKRHEKVCLKANNKSNSLCFKNKASSHFHFDLNKEKSETITSSKVNLNHKSSQCSSASLEAARVEHLNSIGDSQGEDRLGVKITKDKTFQCPSVKLGEKAKYVSRFIFEKEPCKLPLQGLRRSNRLEKKICGKDAIPVTEDLLHYLSSNNEMSSAKKFKPSSSENSMTDINSSPELVENNVMDGENLSCVRINSKVDLNSFYDVYNTGDSSENMSIDSTPEVPVICKLKETKNTSLRELHCSTFNLHAFTNKVIKNCTKYISTDAFHLFGKDKLLNSNSDIATNDYVDEIQNFVSRDTVLKDFENFESINEQENVITDVGPNNNLKHSSRELFTINEEEMSEEDNYLKNVELQTQKENDLVMNRSLEQEDIKLISTNEGMLGVSTNMALADLGILNSDTFNSNSDGRNNSNLLNSKNKNLSEREIIIENSQIESASLVSQSQDALEKKSSHFFKNNSSVTEAKSFYDMNFHSNPLTECLSSLSDGCSLKQKNSERSDEFLSNCISKELFTVPPIEGQINVDVESLDKDKKLNNSNLEATQHDACDKTENLELGQNHSCNNSIEKENFINCMPDCSGVNDIILPVCPNSDKVDSNESHAETLCNKKSENYQNRWKQYSEPKNQRKIYIDTITGNSTYNDPEQHKVQENQNVEINNGICKKSHFFLTHDYSPFLSNTQTPESKLNDNISGIQNDLKNFLENKEKCEWYKKWRIPEEISNINGDSIENMLNDWANPMFNIPYEMSSITESKSSQHVSQMVSFLSSYRFSRNTLSSLQVIGQVDCKFIACILKNFNDRCQDQKLLALFDQHAVHERIRLEKYIEDLYETNEDGEKSVKSVAINSPLEVQFNDEEIRLLHTYQEKLHQIGIHLNINSDSNSCSVHSVPICLVHKGTQELRRSMSDSISVLQNSVKEWLTSLLKTRSIPQVLPKNIIVSVELLGLSRYVLYVIVLHAMLIIARIIFTAAFFKGAVKFGDPLSLEQCRNLLNQLSECKLPFQCAHGRPSVAPILDLKKVEALYKKRSPPQLRRSLTLSKK